MAKEFIQTVSGIQVLGPRSTMLEISHLFSRLSIPARDIHKTVCLQLQHTCIHPGLLVNGSRKRRNRKMKSFLRHRSWYLLVSGKAEVEILREQRRKAFAALGRSIAALLFYRHLC